MSDKQKYFPLLSDVMYAEHTLGEILTPTPLMSSRSLSQRYGVDVWLKREDLQIVRSYKIRGAYNKIRSLSAEQIERGIVCASAGNHAQGVALSCNKLGIKGTIFMPVTTPKQKINQVRMFGGEAVEVVLVGDTFDQSNAAAEQCCKDEGKTFIPPFNDPKVIEGQGTVGLERAVLETVDDAGSGHHFNSFLVVDISGVAEIGVCHGDQAQGHNQSQNQGENLLQISHSWNSSF